MPRLMCWRRRCKFHRLLFHAFDLRVGSRHSLRARLRWKASAGADIQVVSAHRTVILSCRRKAGQNSCSYFNILGNRHGAENDRVDICVQGHVFSCGLH